MAFHFADSKTAVSNRKIFFQNSKEKLELVMSYESE